jgi:hypothetical protein
LPLIAAVVSAMWVLPASAGDGVSIPSTPIPAVTLAQFNLCIGPDCGDRVYGEPERRYYNRYDDDWPVGSVDNWRYYRGGVCRDVAIRERRGDEIVLRHVRRCD